MIRISKLADYALIITAYMSQRPSLYLQANEISEATGVSRPTASKVLKMLTRHGLLESMRGAGGGYKLALDPQNISIADIIQIIEGPMAIMDCSLGSKNCAMYNNCAINEPWGKINAAIVNALDTIKLKELYSTEYKGSAYG